MKWGCPDALAPLENRELQQIASDVMCVRCGQHGRFGDFFFCVCVVVGPCDDGIDDEDDDGDGDDDDDDDDDDDGNKRNGQNPATIFGEKIICGNLPE